MVIEELQKQSAKFDVHRNGPAKMNWLSLEQDIRDALQVYKRRCADGFSFPAEHGIMAHEVLSFISDSVGWHTGRGYEITS